MRRSLIALCAAMTVTACAQGGGSTGSVPPAKLSAAVATECKLLERALEQTNAATGKKRLSIVEGCPGYENVQTSSGIFSNFTEAANFTSAAGAKMPAHVKSGGTAAVRIYRRMIARGTPAAVAAKVSGLPEFAQAVGAAKAMSSQ